MIEYRHRSVLKGPIDRKYAGKWIAIRYRRIIDSDVDLEALCDRLEAQGIEDKAIVMKPLEPGIWIL